MYAMRCIMKIALVIDSFKGSMTSVEIAEEFKNRFEPTHECKVIPISDGGEGFLEAIAIHKDLQRVPIQSYDPLGNVIHPYYFKKGNNAFFELSLSSGLQLLQSHQLNPAKTSTYGLGVMIKDAILNGATNIVIGVGGSSTNDGGAGMLQALGMKFFSKNEEITTHINGELLGKVDALELDDLYRTIQGVLFTVAHDVDNVLLGPAGTTWTYATQKGASNGMLEALEKSMKHFASITKNLVGKDVSNIPGSGAAGGFVFGALAFLNATAVSGIEYVLSNQNIESEIQKADLIVVGEGKLDEQTLRGKAPLGVAKLAKKYNKRVIGIFALSEIYESIDYFDDLYTIVPKFATKEESLSNPHKYLRVMLDHMVL